MSREWIALRPDKDGNPRGYWRDITQRVQRRKRRLIRCPKRVHQQFNLGLEHMDIYEYLDKHELIQEMRNDPAMRGKLIPTKERKPVLILIWVREGNWYSSFLMRGRMRRGCRRWWFIFDWFLPEEYRLTLSFVFDCNFLFELHFVANQAHAFTEVVQ